MCPARLLPVPAGPLWRIFELEKHFARLGHEEDAFPLAIGEVFGSDGFGIAVAKIDLATFFLRDLGSERDFDAAFFDSIFIGADAANVRGMSKDTPRNIFKLVL